MRNAELRTVFDQRIEAFRGNAPSGLSGFFHNSALPTSHSALASLVLLSVCLAVLPAWSAPSPSPVASADPVWFTQIGAWHIHIDSSGGESFISHDSRADAAYSGEATAFVRLNFAFTGIRTCAARLLLSSPPATAGLVVRDKAASYYFLVSRGERGDSLQVLCRRDAQTIRLTSAPVTHVDTTRMSLLVDRGALRIGVGRDTLTLEKPSDFDSLTTVGFECVRGSVFVYAADIDAANRTVRERFRHATLMNLHLDKTLSRTKSSQARP